MLDVRDPSFKLFGETIPVDGMVLPALSAGEISGDSDDNGGSSSEKMADESEAELQAEEGQAEQKSTDETAIRDDPMSATKEEELLNTDHQFVSKATDEEQRTPSCLDGNSSEEVEKDHEKQQGEESKNSQEKAIKKPDKILPCPRCNSMDTKFCYYNNYNVNQPRHFCKNCQRYWTAGGTMRNVPVGAGRRKNKSSSSRYCHISISEALQAAQINLPNGVHHMRQQPEAGLNMNGTVLTFGTDSPLCESMASLMNLADKKVLNGTRNGFQVQGRSKENGEDHSSRSSTVTTSTSMEQGGLKEHGSSNHQIPQNINGFTGHQVPCFPGYQLAYGWNPAVPLPPPPPGYFLPAGFPPMPFYPAPFWNGAAIPWNIPWASPSSLSPKTPGSNPSSPTLGKHSRDEDTLMPSSEAEKSPGSSQVLVPKTLRIDDPEEAAKSSIWTTLGIKKVEPSGNGGFFKGLQSKVQEKNHRMESSPVLNANPAAMARSISFQETT